MNESIVTEDSTNVSPNLFREVLAQYRGVDGRYDEALTGEGLRRPGWNALFDRIGGLSTNEIERRVAQAQRQMDVDGVAFNPHDEGRGVVRPWVLDPVPLVIQQSEWVDIEQGLEQRAKLCDLVLLDLLGPQTLLHERVLPPEILFAHPRYFPAYHSLVPRPRKHLQLYAADLARSADGKWQVTSDRTRSPFGLGYVLENRLVTSRMLPAAFDACNVRRLAPFFMSMQATLKDLAHRFRDNPRIALWTKGPTSRAYFEDAFLARYLGYTLVEGGDLAVRNNRVMLKTLGGLLPVEVLLRRVEDHDCDPAELIGSSSFGVSGLLEVVRSGHVAIANSIGSSLSESPMLLAFLPLIARHFLSEELKLPSVDTWWCGHHQALQYVLDHLDQLTIRHAFRRDDEAPYHPRQMSQMAKEELRQRIKSSPAAYVGQAPVAPSTAPVWDRGRLHPWSLALRTFMIANGDNYEALPGGLARVAQEPDVLLHNMTSGEKSQDVWILAEHSVDPVSLLKVSEASIELTRGGAELPSRAADNMYWLGRNLERAEQLSRLTRVTLQHFTRQEDTEQALKPLIAACTKAKQLPEKLAQDLPARELLAEKLVECLLDSTNSYSLKSVVNSAETTALRVRDRIALDHLRIISDLRGLFDVQLSAGELAATEMIAVLDGAIIQLNALSGLASESMTRTLGWRFLDLGRRIERAYQTASAMNQLLPLRPAGGDITRSLEFCLEIHDSFMTYRNRYLANMQLAAVLDLLLCDETNPRSILFQLQTISGHVDRLPRSHAQAMLSLEQRCVLTLLNSIQLAEVGELSSLDKRGELTALHKLLKKTSEQLPRLSDAVSGRFLIHAGFQRHFAVDLIGSVTRNE